jgi:hypothetical protein
MKLALLFLSLLATGANAATPLTVRDPNASFLDVQARRQALKNAQTPRLREAIANLQTCTGAPVPAPPAKDLRIPSRYMSGGHGELNPLEHTLSEPFYRVQDAAAFGANQYLVTGDPKEAACVINDLLPWAQAKALLDYDAKDNPQVWYQSAWSVASLSLSVSVIRAEPTLNVQDRDRVIAWLREAAHKVLSESRGPRSGTSRNNHFFWRGLAATAAGVISNDNGLFQTGIRIYDEAISEIDARGAFPLEMERHELSMHYQAFALEALVMIAELASRQGYNIFALEENHHHLSDAVAFMAKAIADPSIVKAYTPDAQQVSPDLDPGRELLSWTEFWNAHFHDPAWKDAFTKPYSSARLAGSTTLYAAPIDEKVPTK